MKEPGLKLRLAVSTFLAVVLLALAPVAGARAPVPEPRATLGFNPGEDRRLADWATLASYFARLDAASDRVRVEEIGRTTLGKPMLLATISSPANLARLGRLRDIQRRLADPRTIASEDEARALVAEGRAVVLVTCGIHSSEVGSNLAATVIAHRLATDDSPETREILDSCVILLVPSLNPDGVDIVKRWYDRTLGTAYEGEAPPELYHHYTGHDNNRDWYAFTQAETRAVVDRAHNAWHPQIVNDIHQQGSYGSRLFLPPYIDPVEPNVPPEIVAGVNAIGTAVAWGMTASGRAGVVTDAIYDAWTPARAYSHYHGGMRILSETASAKMATPIAVKPEELRPGRNYDARRESANFPLAWRGGPWDLANIVDYMTTSAHLVMREAARNRERLLATFYRIGRNAVTPGPGEPFAFLVPPDPELLTADANPTSAVVRGRVRAALLDTLARGGVEIWLARESFDAGGRTYPAGTAVIDYHQPYGAFAKALLERQRYPDRRLYEGGPPLAPYDVTAHTLSLLMGFEAVRIDERFTVPPGKAYRLAPSGGRPIRVARVGVYRGATAPMDEGWTRWVFDQFGVRHTTLDERDMRGGNLREKYDAIVLPDAGAAELAGGRKAETAPPEMTGGIGETGAAALARFVEDGGTLVALNQASRYAIQALNLPVRDALAGTPASAFYCPGSILGLDVTEPASPLTSGIARRTVAWFEDGPALEVASDEPSVRVLARFAPADRLLVSGWLLGTDQLAGKAALVEVARGRGRVVLFAFRPQYRGQSFVTLPMLFNALAAAPPP
jgi:hypothetical protein